MTAFRCVSCGRADPRARAALREGGRSVPPARPRACPKGPERGGAHAAAVGDCSVSSRLRPAMVPSLFGAVGPPLAGTVTATAWSVLPGRAGPLLPDPGDRRGAGGQLRASGRWRARA